MNELQLTARREQFCAAYQKALTDPAFRVLLQHQPVAAMSQFGFAVRRPTAAIGIDAWPTKWYASPDGPPLPPV